MSPKLTSKSSVVAILITLITIAFVSLPNAKRVFATGCFQDSDCPSGYLCDNVGGGNCVTGNTSPTCYRCSGGSNTGFCTQGHPSSCSGSVNGSTLSTSGCGGTGGNCSGNNTTSCTSSGGAVGAIHVSTAPIAACDANNGNPYIDVTWNGDTDCYNATSYSVWHVTGCYVSQCGGAQIAGYSGCSLPGTQIASLGKVFGYKDYSVTSGSLYNISVSGADSSTCSACAAADTRYGGSTAWCNVTAPSCPPGVATSLTSSSACVSSSPQNTVSWNNAGGATSYNLYRDNGAGLYSMLYSGIPQNSTGTTTKVDPSPTAGVTYSYYVVGVNGTGSGLASLTTSVPTQTCAPSAPGTPSLMSSVCSGATPVNTISWADTNTNGYYQVWRAHASDSSDATKIADNLTTKTYADSSSTTSGYSYNYWVKACFSSNDCTSGNGNWLQSATCDTTPPDSATINGFPVPGQTCYPQTAFPLSVSVSAHDAGVGIGSNGISVHLYETDGTFIKDYTTGCSPAVQACNASISIPYTDLITNQPYYLKISATDAVGNGPYNAPGISGNFYANTNCVSPYFSTSGGGDVHSNTRINTPGGP